MVSTAKLRKAQDRVINSRPFNRMATEILTKVAAAAGSDERVMEHPLLARREEKTAQLVLVTADRGLAGAFNTNLIKAAQQFFSDKSSTGAAVELEVCGRKGRDFFSRRPVKISGEVTGISQNASYADAEKLANKLIKRFEDGEVDSVYLLFNEFKSVLTQKVTLKRVLPMALPEGDAPQDYIFEQPPAELLGRMLPAYVRLQVLEAFLETAAAEHAARMTAMESASTNASEVISKLTLYMNQVRQASITREIIEVVSGAGALE
jgi:F-type H+-transporting ATPase subunit gamma